MPCSRCGSFQSDGGPFESKSLHTLVRAGERIVFRNGCLRQVALFRGTEDDMRRVVRPEMSQELWHQGDVIYLLRPNAGRPSHGTATKSQDK